MGNLFHLPEQEDHPVLRVHRVQTEVLVDRVNLALGVHRVNLVYPVPIAQQIVVCRKYWLPLTVRHRMVLQHRLTVEKRSDNCKFMIHNLYLATHVVDKMVFVIFQ